MAPPYDKNLVFLAKKNTLTVYEKCITVLKRLLDNLITDPANPKYRSFRIENKTIKENLLIANGVEEILFCMGFRKTETDFVLPDTAELKVLIQWRQFLDYPYHDDAEENNYPKPTRSYLERIAFPRRLRTPNPFLQNLENLSDHVMQYEDLGLKEYAKKIIPIDDLTSRAAEKLFQIQEAMTTGKISTPKEPCIRDLLLTELTKWFHEEFFEWANTLPCKVCGKEDYTQKSQRVENGNRVEIGFCCGVETKFIRFNDIADLLASRKGRCGEYANCFTFICRALDYKARWVTSQFDHVWTEVYSEGQKRWIHVDPSDNVIDAPLMYQHGWKRTVDYVFAFSKEDIQDVTWRYSSNHKATKLLRQRCSEDELSKCIIEIRQKRQSVLTEREKKELSYLTMSELIELMVEREPTENELKGRSSGDMSWKLGRGECSFANVFSFEPLEAEINSKQFNLRYSCSLDKYERYLKESDNTSTILSTYNSWGSCQFSSLNIFRKVEKDWKMAYLARNEGTDVGEISWRFDFSKANLVISNYKVRCDKQIYENGILEIDATTDNGNTDLKGSSAFTIKATFSGGRGDCSWQHSQLFRQPLSSKEFPFELCIEFM